MAWNTPAVVPSRLTAFQRQGTRWVLRLAVPAAMALCTPLAHASEMRCRTILDEDARNHCLAMATRQAIYCQAIHDADAKFLCLAYVKSDKSQCTHVHDPVKQRECTALLTKFGK